MENNKPDQFDYKQIKQQVKEQFRSGKSLFGKDGAFAPLLQDMLNSILEGEMEGHMDEQQRQTGNRKTARIRSSSKLLTVLSR